MGIHSIMWNRDGSFGSKVGQIGPKWDKSRAFLDQISVHFGAGANKKNKTDIIYKKSYEFLSEISLQLFKVII